MSPEPRPAGLPLVGVLPWGSRVCELHETKEDLLQAVVPFFAAGLAGEEAGLWVTGEAIEPEQARRAMLRACPEAKEALRSGRMTVVASCDRTEAALLGRLDEALQHGWTGLRVAAAATAADREQPWLDAAVGHNILAAVCFPRTGFDGLAVMELVRTHRLALVRAAGEWQLFESAEAGADTETRRREEQRMRRKLAAVLSPDGDIGALELDDIVDASAIQSLMEDLHRLVPIPMAVLDAKGRVLVGVGWSEICTRFHRAYPASCRRCRESDTKLSEGVSAGKSRRYRCGNQMWDMATPIVVGGRRLGNIFLGQFFFDDERPDAEAFRAQARRFGFDEKEYLAALERVPRFSRSAVDAAMSFCMKLADTIARLSWSNIQLVREAAVRRSAEAELRDKAQELAGTAARLAEANRELETFSYTVSHDLRAPLRHITGYASLLEHRVGARLDAKSREHLGRITESASHMGRLIEQLLELSRLGRTAIKWQDLDLDALVREIRAEVQPPDREIRWKLAPLPRVRGDAALLRAALTNLLSNAVKFTGRVERAAIEVGWRPAPEGRVELFVKDNGAGFDMSHSAKLFGVFQRLHSQSEFEGTGVGLAAAQRIVLRHGGSIRAEGAPGRGATFTVTLPAA